MIKKWDQSLVGKRVTNSHYKEDSGGWCVEILYIGENCFFGKEMNLNAKSDWPSSEHAYGFRQFDWELCEEKKQKEKDDNEKWDVKIEYRDGTVLYCDKDVLDKKGWFEKRGEE